MTWRRTVKKELKQQSAIWKQAQSMTINNTRLKAFIEALDAPHGFERIIYYIQYCGIF